MHWIVNSFHFSNMQGPARFRERLKAGQSLAEKSDELVKKKSAIMTYAR